MQSGLSSYEYERRLQNIKRNQIEQNNIEG